MNMETCRQAAAELYSSVKKAIQLYTLVSVCHNFIMTVIVV